ncbi:PREDICTED: uncharacterized protein C2orf54 homolog, partial [Merops nubicus]|uniref:uncharacterized protein C2orf54 homolog n=1 Tax=Merops nubicus TaxID=57421 RepID=UPI0004F04C22
MVLLWSTELFPSPEDWQGLEGTAYRLLVILLHCLPIHHLPDLQHPEKNIFQEVLDLISLYLSLLHLPAKNGSCWNTACFDILLSQIQQETTKQS